MKHHNIREKVEPFPKLQVLCGGRGFWNWVLGSNIGAELFVGKTLTCPNCGKTGTEEQIKDHDCKYAFGE